MLLLLFSRGWFFFSHSFSPSFLSSFFSSTLLPFFSSFSHLLLLSHLVLSLPLLLSNRSIYLERSPRHPGAATSVVAKRDPQLPQGFTPIAEELTIWPGDRVTMTCVYDASGSDRLVVAGSTHNDEM